MFRFPTDIQMNTGSMSKMECCDFLMGSRYSNRLGGWGSNPGLGKNFIFSTTFRPAPGPIQPLIQWVLVGKMDGT
jgi:hypothetical protein